MNVLYNLENETKKQNTKTGESKETSTKEKKYDLSPKISPRWNF